MRKAILDVDTGIDDALGIMLAMRSGELDVLGITTVNGNVSLETATNNTCKILDLISAEPSISVYPGASRPLMRDRLFEHRVHGQDGLGGALADMLPTDRVNRDMFGPDFIIEQAKRFPGEVTLIATGPLTNVALALAKHPSLIHELKEVILMGGAVQTYGNITPVAEYNMHVDPEAAQLVLRAGFPRLVMVGLDVTRKALLTNKHIDALGSSEIADYVRKSTADYMQRYFERNGVEACAMHDPLAVGAAIWPELVETTRYSVDVETRSELCDGQTVCDFQNRLQREPNADVCLKVDSDEFINRFIAVLHG
ncbi:nucleoside hydrolase [Paenibacillus azoreducens]|uniref:Nucleoside hydrolase n=1 Tax=Paenibacillus azoreducens TaxID=116718 RepID=A0A919Y7K0_9BACL|nr:nucleoside hydrolase [Paenibacillus azoreducens]GIO45724.1 nucleoside hydrolase [Paenibacillus azoreducens]